MERYVQVFVTIGKREEAEGIVREVVSRRLAACGQVAGPITSTYWWDGKIEQSQEWLCILKTRSDLYDALEQAVKGLHPYEVPEIVAVPLVRGNREYLAWLDKATEIEVA